MFHFQGFFHRVPFLWNGKACWKNNGGDFAGPAFIYWHPKGGWFLGARLIKPTAQDWSGTKAWMPEIPGGFGNLHCPWWSENPSLWRCVSLVARHEEKIHELSHEVQSIQADLLGTKIQLDTATAMLQQEWDPMNADEPSSSNAKFVEPTAKAAPKPSDDSQVGVFFHSKALVARFVQPLWLHFLSLGGYIYSALVATFV